MTTRPYSAESNVRRAGAEESSPAEKGLQRSAGVAALLVGVLLLIAAIDLARNALQPGIATTWFSQLQNNWLIVIIKLHAGFQGVQPDDMARLNFPDLAILFFTGITYLGLFVTLRKTSKILSILALVQPFLGIVIFIVTQSAGRSAVMGAGLVVSLAMLRGRRSFGFVTAMLGTFASAFLLIGDLTVSSMPSVMIAGLTAIGYILLTVWFFRIGRRLLLLKDVERHRQTAH